MAIGERIHHFVAQKILGQQLGFSDSQADVPPIAQYEKGARSPKEKYLKRIG